MTSELAQRAGYNPYEMHPEEKKYFPEYVTNEQQYLEIRNAILAAWKRNPNEYLSWEKAAERVQVHHSCDHIPAMPLLLIFSI